MDNELVEELKKRRKSASRAKGTDAYSRGVYNALEGLLAFYEGRMPEFQKKKEFMV